MNAGLSNLATLKAWLLPASMVAGADYDAQITAIGLGTAAMVEEWCRRNFARAVADVCEFSAARHHIVTRRYPIEEITKLELSITLAQGWLDQGTPSDWIINISKLSGLVEFWGRLGTHSTRARITYTGGYFFEDLEPTDAGYPTAQPAGSEALPDVVRLAWLTQCEHIWTQRDKLGVAIADKPNEIYSGALAKIELLDGVQTQLAPHRRFSLT